MSLLLKSGLPIDEAIELSEDVTQKREIKNAIEESKKLVDAGKTLSSGLKKHKKVIPGFMIRITEAGEKSGTLEKSMQELSNQFEDRVTNRLKTLTTLIEPFLLLVVGLLVGGLMLAIIAPIYNLIGQIGQR
jgi:type II secretory pathway component PulF